MKYETELKKYNIEKDVVYNCEAEFQALLKQPIKYNTCSFSILNNETSPMIIVKFTDYDIFFADPKLVLDKYDKESIIDDNDFKYMNTYNIKFFKEFIERIKLNGTVHISNI